VWKRTKIVLYNYNTSFNQFCHIASFGALVPRMAKKSLKSNFIATLCATA
jgi:hypothetical protein